MLLAGHHDWSPVQFDTQQRRGSSGEWKLPEDPAGFEGVARDTSHEKSKFLKRENEGGVPPAATWVDSHSIDDQVKQYDEACDGTRAMDGAGSGYEYTELCGNSANPIGLVTSVVTIIGDKVLDCGEDDDVGKGEDIDAGNVDADVEVLGDRGRKRKTTDLIGTHDEEDDDTRKIQGTGIGKRKKTGNLR